MDNLSLLMVPGRSSSPPLMLTPIQALTQGFESGEAPRRAMSPASADSHLREGFRIGTLGLMIRYQDGSALTDMPTIYSLPNSPPWFSGMANLHGALIPVCDMAQYLGVERTAQAKPMLLVLGHAADAVGGDPQPRGRARRAAALRLRAIAPSCGRRAGSRSRSAESRAAGEARSPHRPRRARPCP